MYTTTDELYLVLRIPHMHCDATSISLILQELQAAYKGGHFAQPETVHRSMFSDHNRKKTSSKPYWEMFLSGATPTHFPETRNAEWNTHASVRLS